MRRAAAVALLDKVFGQLGGMRGFAAPCRPHIMITVGGLDLMWMRAASLPPMSSVRDSFTILMTCWAGVMLLSTSSPTALAVTLATNSLATL